MYYKELDLEIGELLMTHKNINISHLAFKYGVTRNTIRSHIDALENKNKKERKRRECGILSFDAYIKEQIQKHDPSIKSLYMDILNMSSYDKIGSYSNFKQYIERHYNDLRIEAREKTAKYRFETEPGDQLQVDWIERLKLHLKNGDLVEFNIWNGTLGFSRKHVFLTVSDITESTFKKCLIETIVILNGRPRRVLTDNMSAIVSIRNNKRYVHPTIIQFMKDLDIELKFCKAKHPYTKGKNETSNKYQTWLDPYDFKFDTIENLYKGVNEILSQTNYQENSETKLAPNILFEFEKNKLGDLPNIDLLTKHHSNFTTYKVKNTALIHINGAEYGVPSKYINSEVLVSIEKNELSIYNKQIELLSKYQVYTSGKHYALGLYSIKKLKDESIDDYNKRVTDNLERIAKFNELKEYISKYGKL